MARSTKLTKEKIQEVYNAIAGGNTHAVTAALCGISEATFYNWHAAGRKAKSGLKREFYERVKQAEALAQAKHVDMIRKAAEGKGPFEKPDWKASAWYLERRYPETWGRQHHEHDVKHTGEVTQRHEHETRKEVVHRIANDEESQRLLEQLYQRQKH